MCLSFRWIIQWAIRCLKSHTLTESTNAPNERTDRRERGKNAYVFQEMKINTRRQCIVCAAHAFDGNKKPLKPLFPYLTNRWARQCEKLHVHHRTHNTSFTVWLLFLLLLLLLLSNFKLPWAHHRSRHHHSELNTDLFFFCVYTIAKVYLRMDYFVLRLIVQRQMKNCICKIQFHAFPRKYTTMFG